MPTNPRYGDYTYKSSGTNSQGDHHCQRDYGSSARNQNSGHSSFNGGGYAYSNPDGSSYYKGPSGASTYTTPIGVLFQVWRSRRSRKEMSSSGNVSYHTSLSSSLPKICVLIHVHVKILILESFLYTT